MFKLEGLDAFVRGMDDWIKEVEKEAIEVYRGIAVGAFFMVAENTPQWSGNAASNWNLSVGSPDTSVITELLEQYTDKMFFSDILGGQFIDAPVNAKGDPKAIALAANYNSGNQYRITDLDAKVFISNSSVNLDNEAYIQMLEDNAGGFLRPENEPGHMVQETVAALGVTYGLLSGSDIANLKVKAKKL